METLGIDSAFWQSRRVLLTGHTGFKGAWLSLWLASLGAHVQGLALEPESSPNLFSLSQVERDISSHIADIRDFAAIEKVMQNFKPEVVIHMAAQPLVRRSYREPLETLDTNIMGTANLLQAARQIGDLKAILIVTSDKCYQNQEREAGYSEHEPMGGHDPYSVSKGCAELITSAFRDSFFPIERYAAHGVVIASARAGNVFGGGDWSEDRLIPDAVRAIAGNQILQVRYPHAIRPWQFVLEPLAGYLLLVQAMVQKGPLYSGAWNFGPESRDEITVESILLELQQIFGAALRWESDKRETPHEAGILRLNTEKSRSQLGWNARWGLKQGLLETASWYKNVLSDPGAARSLCFELLEKFSKPQNQSGFSDAVVV